MAFTLCLGAEYLTHIQTMQKVFMAYKNMPSNKFLEQLRWIYILKFVYNVYTKCIGIIYKLYEYYQIINARWQKRQKNELKQCESACLNKSKLSFHVFRQKNSPTVPRGTAFEKGCGLFPFTTLSFRSRSLKTITIYKYSRKWNKSFVNKIKNPFICLCCNFNIKESRRFRLQIKISS